MSILTSAHYDNLNRLIEDSKSTTSFLKSHLLPYLPISGQIALIVHLFSCQIDNLNEAKRKFITPILEKRTHFAGVLSDLSRNNNLQIPPHALEPLKRLGNENAEVEINVSVIHEIDSRLNQQLDKECIGHRKCLIQGIVCNIVSVAFVVFMFSTNFFDEEQALFISIGCGMQALICCYTLTRIRS